MRLGAWLRSGEAIGWLATGTIPNSLHRVPFFYLFLACDLCHVSFFLSFFILFLFCVVDAMYLGTWLRSGEGIVWLAAAGTIPNSL